MTSCHRFRALIRVAALVGASAGPSRAEVEVSLPGTWRVRDHSLSDFALDGVGTPHGQNHWGTERFRLRPRVATESVDLNVEADVVSGQIYGDTLTPGAEYVERRAGDPGSSTSGLSNGLIRQAWVEIRTPVGVVRAGQMASAWGMGLLANSGEDHEDERSPFAGEFEGVRRWGDRWNGDLVDRLMFATRPLWFLQGEGVASKLTLALGVDRVFQDEQADALDGDSAWQAVAALFYPGERVFLGLYGAHRSQADDAGTRLEATALDAFGRVIAPWEMLGATLRVQGEIVGLLGATDRLKPEASPDGVDIEQLGWAAALELSWPRPRIAAGVQLGYASGDADLEDGQQRAMTFDPDHRVGLVLFPEIVRRQSLRGAERAADPDRAGRPPDGVAWLPTDGSVRNAAYVAPGILYRPGRATIAVGAVLAWSPAPHTDPDAAFAQGGDPVTPLGQGAEAWDMYGAELDAYVGYTLHPDGVRSLEIGAEWGLFVAGQALEGLAREGIVSALSLRGDLRF